MAIAVSSSCASQFKIQRVVDIIENTVGAVLTAAHCFVNAAGQRYTITAVQVLVGAYIHPWPPEFSRFPFHHVLLQGDIDIDYKFPQEYREPAIDYIKWDIAVLTLPPSHVVPVTVVPANQYPTLGKSFSTQVATETRTC